MSALQLLQLRMKKAEKEALSEKNLLIELARNRNTEVYDCDDIASQEGFSAEDAVKTGNAHLVSELWI